MQSFDMHPLLLTCIPSIARTIVMQAYIWTDSHNLLTLNMKWHK
jgi:hypothetical protein